MTRARSREGNDPKVASGQSAAPTATTLFRILEEDEHLERLLEQIGAVVTEFDAEAGPCASVRAPAARSATNPRP